MEKLVLSQVSSYLYSHNHYNTCQLAYRPGHSTETALLKVVNYLFLSLSKSNIYVLALLDFSSAFDTIDYRPISLLNNIYKLFTKIITNRITRTLDENQPREQAGFRRGFSTIDHLHAVNQLIEKCAEYKIPLVVGLVDYNKAFDSVEITDVIEALQEQGVDPVYVNVLKHINKQAKSFIRLHKDSKPFQVSRGIRQGDTSSPKLFTACLEKVFRKLNWSRRGILIDGEYLSHLRFADDIIILHVI